MGVWSELHPGHDPVSTQPSGAGRGMITTSCPRTRAPQVLRDLAGHRAGTHSRFVGAGSVGGSGWAGLCRRSLCEVSVPMSHPQVPWREG